MGFMTGVITGVALAAGAAAWYMSRSGERFRDQYRVDRKLGEFGDQLEARSREIQSSVNTQLADIRTKSKAVDANGSGGSLEEALDATQASAAEAAAELTAGVEAKAAKIKKAAKSSTD